MPFFGVLKQELYGKDLMEKLGKEDIDILVDLTRDSIEIIGKETQSVDFWDNYPKQKRLKSYIISHILLPNSKKRRLLFNKRNEIAQKLLELSYHTYGG